MQTTDDQEELFVVVDENDSILGYRSRYECHHDKTLIHRTAGVLVFDGDRFLLQKRSLTKDTQPGRWGISSAGHVMKGETYEETAIRELEEEIGLIGQTLTFKKTFLERTSEESEMMTLFTCESKGPFILNKTEVREVRFFTISELIEEMKNGTVVLSDGAQVTLKQINIL
jgi:isopentenyl-diphosphate delta-isomerase type 1